MLTDLEQRLVTALEQSNRVLAEAQEWARRYGDIHAVAVLQKQIDANAELLRAAQ